MAVSLEARSPLLDHRVVEFAWRLPMSVRLRGVQGKWLLKQLLGRYLTREIYQRPKHGFDVPIAAWRRGPLRDWACDLAAPARLRREGFLDAARVQGLLQEHLQGRRDRSAELWAILMFEAWLERAAAREPLRPAVAA
jgi:asparagine synthase (glutamine-hydrolysing)